MGALVRLVGLVLIVFAGYSLFTTFQDQILGEAIKTQTPDFLDFFVDVATPETTEADITFGIIYGIVFFVGLIMLIR